MSGNERRRRFSATLVRNGRLWRDRVEHRLTYQQLAERYEISRSRAAQVCWKMSRTYAVTQPWLIYTKDGQRTLLAGEREITGDALIDSLVAVREIIDNLLVSEVDLSGMPSLRAGETLHVPPLWFET